MQLDNQIAVVTGAGAGIGRAIAHTLARAGAGVAVADLDLGRAESVAREIEGEGLAARPFPVDVADEGSVETLRGAVVAALGVPDIVVNNAGWDIVQPFMATSREFRRKVIEINLLGPITVSHAFLEAMIAAGKGGRIVNIGSDAGRVGSSGETVYAGAKGGVIAFTKSLAREVARHKVTVNCVCPGPTDTALFQSLDEKLRESLVRAIPFKRLAQPEDIAEGVLFFASPGAAYVTGQVLSISGGLTMAG